MKRIVRDQLIDLINTICDLQQSLKTDKTDTVITIVSILEKSVDTHVTREIRDDILKFLNSVDESTRQIIIQQGFVIKASKRIFVKPQLIDLRTERKIIHVKNFILE
jgi:hypothetical protein